MAKAERFYSGIAGPEFKYSEKRLRGTAESFSNWGTIILILTLVGAVVLALELSTTCREVLSSEFCDRDMSVFWVWAIGLGIGDAIVLVPLYRGTAAVLNGLAYSQKAFGQLWRYLDDKLTSESTE